MLAAQLIQANYPNLHVHDTVVFALQLMEEYEVQHLPVLDEDKFVGLVVKEELLNLDETETLESSRQRFIPFSIKKEEHFLTVLKIITQQKLSLVPVVSEQKELLGIIPASIVLEYTAQFLGTDEPGGIIVLEIEKRNFSFGEISRLEETNDAYITQLNTYTEKQTGLVIVTLKINKIEVSDIVATFQRYEYVVRYYFGEEQYANELKENYNHLMAYLNI
jgi:CBS domain-containing protein